MRFSQRELRGLGIVTRARETFADFSKGIMKTLPIVIEKEVN
jgi:hypothetical protein